MAVETILKKKKEDNYLIEDHEDFCIVKRKRGNNKKLKVLYFPNSIVKELEELEEEESEKDLKALYDKLMKDFRKRLNSSF